MARLAFAALFVVGIAACGFSLDGYSGGTATPDGGTPAPDSSVVADGSGADATPLTPLEAGTDAGFACPTGKGAAMVAITVPAGPAFCIDSTEVTNDQYRAFLNSNPATTGQPAVCSWNATYQPTDGDAFGDLTKGNFPIVTVDWCDAHAFCAWAGKRLCGKIGGGAIPNTGENADPASSQRTFVCTKNGTQTYPYGNAFNAAACNAGAHTSLEAVASRLTCVGGFPGVYDLVGNVGEWSDDCETAAGALDNCPDNSSSFEYVSSDAPSSDQCTHFDDQPRNSAFDDLGIRCCYDGTN